MTTRYLLVDTVASGYIGHDPEVSLGDKGLLVKGFEAYLVEQWACERGLNCVVCSYTGNSANTVAATVLNLPQDKNSWSELVVDFMELMSRNHLLTKDTPQGRMFIANLSSFPSNKTLIPMDTPFNNAINSFVISENLKRLGCSGRLAVSLSAPSEATRANFYELYHVSTEVPLVFAIREIVTLVQISLYYCGMLDPTFVDGFLCDHTIKAANKWWEKFGSHSSSSATRSARGFSGTGPGAPQKTVAAIIGFVLGCNYRFSLVGLKPPKDCFNVHQFLQCIYAFQKNERLDKTSRLNTATVHRLRDLTAKQVATGPDLISSLKTTVKENLRGKIREGDNTFETDDIAALAAHAKGARAKYLWKGIGCRFTPMQPVNYGDCTDPLCGIPVYSLVDEGLEPKSLLWSPLQKNNASKLLSRKPYHLPRMVSETDSDYSPKPVAVPRGGDNLINSDSPHIDSQDTEASEAENSNSRAPSEGPPHFEPVPTALKDSVVFTKDDTYTPQKHQTELRRVQSCSSIENMLFRWNYPVSLARVYRDYSKAVTLQQELEHQLDSNKKTFNELRETLASRGADFTSENRYSDTIKYRIGQSTRKEEAVKQQIANLEAITDKLDFQWAFLVHQIEEVENSVENFGKKVASTAERWESVQARREGGGLAAWACEMCNHLASRFMSKSSTPAASTPAASTPAASTPAASTPAASTPAASTPAASTPAASTPAASTSAASTQPSTTQQAVS